jgi:hypothetical protein
MNFANNTPHMLLLLIPIAWLIVVTLFVAVCRTAARADRPVAPRAAEERHSPHTAVDGLVMWEDDPIGVALGDTRPRKARRLRARHGIPHHGRHGIPHHGIR